METLESVGTKSAITISKVNLHFGNTHVLKDISFNIPAFQVTALIGPSGCGKSTLLRSFNRMHDLNPLAKIIGEINIDGISVLDPHLLVNHLRRSVGMVFQKPNPFAKSIYDNIAYGLRINGFEKSEIPSLVEDALRRSYLWEEVKDKLKQPAYGLSGGQQQRLCIARSIAIQPKILLMDEPCSALDPISTHKIEELILDLRGDYTIVIVTHNMQQAMRVSDKTAFMYLGEVIEFDDTEVIFHHPKETLTKNYISGVFG